DKEAAAKLAEKVVSKLQSANMLSTPEAGTLALMLLNGGPRPDQPAATTDQSTNQNSSAQVSLSRFMPQVLSPSAYTTVMSTVIDFALRTNVTPPTQRGPAGGPNGRGGGRNFGTAQTVNNQSPPSTAQVEQNNARRLLNGLQQLLPQIDQY